MKANMTEYLKHYTSLITKIDGEVKDKIDQLITDGFINKNAHPSGELFIYNYSDKCQYENMWTNESLQCRGLIADKEGNIVARPFPKFFNYNNDHLEEELEVFEKLDGSLGILYFHKSKPYIATRGSFVGEQAERASKMLYEKYGHILHEVSHFCARTNVTLLFEIIYPSNRIVVDYKDREELVLLEVIENATGKHSKSLFPAWFPSTKTYSFDIDDLSTLSSLNNTNEEGFVIRYAGGIRQKIKFEEYVKLHALITLNSPRRVWEMVRDNEPFDELISKIPDELYADLKKQREDLLKAYDEIVEEYETIYEHVTEAAPDSSRKELAAKFMQHEYAKILFSILDNKDYSRYIWELLKPKREITE